MFEIPRHIAQRVKLVVLDVDGVLTDNGVYIGESSSGERVELKRFDIMDGLGVRMLARAGMHVAFVSGRASKGNRIRAAELEIEYDETPGGFKLPAVEKLLKKHDVGWEDLACVCDDLADMPILLRAGLPVAVANAVAEVKATALWITQRHGGSGAVREFAEALLKARGVWASLVDEYVEERSKS